MPVPVALEQLLRVVFSLQQQEIAELREAGLDLLAQGVAVIGGVVAAAVLDADVDQAPEGVAGADRAARGVLDVQVEDHAGVALEDGGLVGVREVQQLDPVALAELPARRGQRRVVGDRPVAREHAAPQEVLGAIVDRVLEVAVEEAVADALVERAHQAADVAHLDHALELAPRYQAQRHRVDEAEQAVAADRQVEQVRVLAAAALQELPLRVQEPERLDVADEWRKRQAPAVNAGPT